MNKQDYLLIGFIIFFVVGGFIIGYRVSEIKHEPRGALLGKWYPDIDLDLKNPENYIKIRVDNRSIDYGIENIIKHEMGHEIYFRLYGYSLFKQDKKDFADMCEDNITKCVEMLG